MSEQIIEISLPDATYERLLQVADGSGWSLEEVVLCSLRAGMPPSLSKVPASFHPDLLALNELDDQDLWRVITNELPVQKPLTAEQKQADFGSLRRAYAFALLKWRGHPVPEPHEFFVD